MLPIRMFLRSFSSLMWSSTSSNCATAKTSLSLAKPKTSSSLAKPMRLQEPRYESAQIEGQRNGCRYEKEQASHDLTAIQHCWLPVSVWYLPRMIKGTVKGQGSLTYYSYPYPQVPLPITLKGYPYPCYCLEVLHEFLQYQTAWITSTYACKFKPSDSSRELHIYIYHKFSDFKMMV